MQHSNYYDLKEVQPAYPFKEQQQNNLLRTLQDRHTFCINFVHFLRGLCTFGWVPLKVTLFAGFRATYHWRLPRLDVGGNAAARGACDTAFVYRTLADCRCCHIQTHHYQTCYYRQVATSISYISQSIGWIHSTGSGILEGISYDLVWRFFFHFSKRCNRVIAHPTRYSTEWREVHSPVVNTTLVHTQWNSNTDRMETK